jgi:hypothetical protein
MSEITIYNSLEVLIDPSYTFFTRINAFWYLFQFTTFLPMILITLIRLYQSLTLKDEIEESKFINKSTWIDILLKIYSIFWFITYSIKIFINFYHLHDRCRFILNLHHIVTIHGGFNFIKCKHFAWFIILPLAFHAILLIFPEIMLMNYLYFLSVTISFFMSMMKPYYGKETYDNFRNFVIRLSIVLLIWWFIDCNNKCFLEKNEFLNQ